MIRLEEEKEIQYRNLVEEEIEVPLFAQFHRRQVVNRCLRNIDGAWCVREEPFIDEWSARDYQFLVACLKNTVRTGGLVCAAFCGRALKGFASVEGELFGTGREYLDLTSIHVSEDMRGCGIGKELFRHAAEWAGEHGAKKLYISSHSAVETQAFYAAMGCVDALELNEGHVNAEPFDRQLEYIL